MKLVPKWFITIPIECNKIWFLIVKMLFKKSDVLLLNKKFSCILDEITHQLLSARFGKIWCWNPPPPYHSKTAFNILLYRSSHCGTVSVRMVSQDSLLPPFCHNIMLLFLRWGWWGSRSVASPILFEYCWPLTSATAPSPPSSSEGIPSALTVSTPVWYIHIHWFFSTQNRHPELLR